MVIKFFLRSISPPDDVKYSQMAQWNFVINFSDLPLHPWQIFWPRLCLPTSHRKVTSLCTKQRAKQFTDGDADSLRMAHSTEQPVNRWLTPQHNLSKDGSHYSKYARLQITCSVSWYSIHPLPVERENGWFPKPLRKQRLWGHYFIKRKVSLLRSTAVNK